MSKLPTWDGSGIVYDAKIPLNPDNYMLLRHLFRGATVADVQYDIDRSNDISTEGTEYLLILLRTEKGDFISIGCYVPLRENTPNMTIEIGEVEVDG